MKTTFQKNTWLVLESLTNNNAKKKVSRKDYEIFCKEFVFEKIKGKNFGEAFCYRFDLNPFFFINLSDETSKDFIETLGYLE